MAAAGAGASDPYIPPLSHVTPPGPISACVHLCTHCSPTKHETKHTGPEPARVPDFSLSPPFEGRVSTVTAFIISGVTISFPQPLITIISDLQISNP